MKKASKASNSNSIEKKISKKKISPSPDSKLVRASNIEKKAFKHVKQMDLSEFGFMDKQIMKSVKKINLPEIPRDKDISIYSWNVAGLRSILKKGLLQSFVEKENPDILCLNETKVDEEIVSKENYSNLFGSQYYGYFNCCNVNVKKGYSGTAIFTKFQPISVKFGFDNEEHDNEGRVITMEYYDFYIVATYIPNAGEGLKRLEYRVNSWDKDFQNYIIKLSLVKHLIWIGDLNVCHKEIDIHNPKSNLKSPGFTKEERISFSSFLEMGFIDTFRERNKETVKYSFWSTISNARTSNKGWRLDYAIVNNQADPRIKESDILTEYYGSDHCPIKVVWTCL